MTYEQISNLAESFPNGKIPAMAAGLRRTEGAVTVSTGNSDKFMATFQTMLRINTSPNEWITMGVVIADETAPDVRAAHLAVYEEWKACIPGRGMDVVKKYAPFFDGIEI